MKIHFGSRLAAGVIILVATCAGPAFAGQYDPCAMVSKQDVASAAGVATDEVFTPQSPTKNECVWAVAAHTGIPGQQVALSVQTIDQVKQAHGLGKLMSIIGAVRGIPGLPITNPVLNHIFDDAQTVIGLGDHAGWKNGLLSVVKNETLVQVQVNGTSDSQGLKIAKTVAQSALNHLPVQASPSP